MKRPEHGAGAGRPARAAARSATRHAPEPTSAVRRLLDRGDPLVMVGQYRIVVADLVVPLRFEVLQPEIDGLERGAVAFRSQLDFVLQAFHVQPGIALQALPVRPGIAFQALPVRRGIALQALQVRRGIAPQALQVRRGIAPQALQVRPGITLQALQVQPGIALEIVNGNGEPFVDLEGNVPRDALGELFELRIHDRRAILSSSAHERNMAETAYGGRCDGSSNKARSIRPRRLLGAGHRPFNGGAHGAGRPDDSVALELAFHLVGHAAVSVEGEADAVAVDRAVLHRPDAAAAMSNWPVSLVPSAFSST